MSVMPKEGDGAISMPLTDARQPIYIRTVKIGDWSNNSSFLQHLGIIGGIVSRDKDESCICNSATHLQLLHSLTICIVNQHHLAVVVVRQTVLIIVLINAPPGDCRIP